MYGLLFRIESKPEKFQEMVDFVSWDAEVCRDEEPGTLRFEFYQDPESEHALFVYEAYVDSDAFEVHKQNKPFQQFSSGLVEEWGANVSVFFEGDALFPPTE